MKFFLDSAILSEIETVYKAGVCDGITMNPSLVKKAVDQAKAKGEKMSLEKYIKKALKIAKGTPVSLEVTKLDSFKTFPRTKEPPYSTLELEATSVSQVIVAIEEVVDLLTFKIKGTLNSVHVRFTCNKSTE